jgi:ATP-dependent helicase/nuclease subunit A
LAQAEIAQIWSADDSSSSSKVQREDEREATRQYKQYSEEHHREVDKVVRMKWNWNETVASVEGKAVQQKCLGEREKMVNYQDFQPVLAQTLRTAKISESSGATFVQPNAAVAHGKNVHYLLERLTRQGLMPIPTDQTLAVWLNISIDESQAVAYTVRQIIEAPACQRFFLPENYLRAWNEVELFSAEGRLLRIDRLVEFTDEWMILDFKTGVNLSDHLVVSQDYQKQLQEYALALAQIYQDKTIRAGLITAVGQLIEIEPIQCFPLSC